MSLIGQISSMVEPLGERINCRQGIALAKVTSITDPKNIGRVKLSLISVNDAVSDIGWAFVATPFAGSKRGIFFLPCVGDVVIVAFEDGNVDRPFVIGSMWGGDSKQNPPVTVKDGVNETFLIKTTQGSSITFGDTKDKENITVKTTSGQQLAIDDEKGTLKLGDKDGKNNICIDTKQGTIEIKCTKSVTISVGDGAKITLEASGNAKINATQMVGLEGAQLSMQAKGTAELKANAQLTLESSGIAAVKGAMVKIN